jgi:hypothetical protein
MLLQQIAAASTKGKRIRIEPAILNTVDATHFKKPT